jgi:hypothetical protein
MKQIRKGTFETNSSSTHTLVLVGEMEDYLPLAKHIKINWIDTDDEYVLDSLVDKVSYLASHIANFLRNNCNNYKELIEEMLDNTEFKILCDFIKKKFDKEIRFPENKNGTYDDMDCIVEINHQLIPWGTHNVMEEVLDELIEYMEDKSENRINKEKDLDLTLEEKLEIYFKNDCIIRFGRD